MTTYAGELFDRVQRVDGSTEHVVRVAAGGRPVAEVVFTQDAPGAAPVRSERFVHPDHLGSPDVITRSNGTVLERRSYDPFGKRRSPNWADPGTPPGPLSTSAGFTGHEEDDELGLVYMKGRTYDPRLGRFLQADPVVQAPSYSQSWNRYAYVLNNPLTLTDPSGYTWVWCNWCGQGGSWANVTISTSGPGRLSVVYDGGFTIADVPFGTDGFSRGPSQDAPGHSAQDYTWAMGRAGGSPEAGRDPSEGLGGGGPRDERQTGAGGPGPYPASPTDARARELAREVTKAWNERGGELIEKAAWGEMLALKAVWETIAFQWAIKLGGTIASTLSKACFVAGTEVWTSEGLVPIEQVEVGQLVLSRDEATGELGWKRVVRTFVTADQATLALSLTDEERGEHEQVEATAEHPFWAEGRGWVGAGDLAAGQRVLRVDGRWLRVERVEARAGRRTVYNLEVEGWHTFVVGKLGAWVHNTCDPKNAISAATKIASKISQSFKCRGKCFEFSDKLVSGLKRQGVKGELIEINPGRGMQVYSDTTGSLGDIGFPHRAVRVGNAVFDNMRPGGIPYEQFVEDLGGQLFFGQRGVSVTTIPF